MVGVLPTFGPPSSRLTGSSGLVSTTLTQSTASFLTRSATNTPSSATVLGTPGCTPPLLTGCESSLLGKGGTISYDILKLILEQQQAAFRAGLEVQNARFHEPSPAPVATCSKQRRKRIKRVSPTAHTVIEKPISGSQIIADNQPSSNASDAFVTQMVATGTPQRIVFSRDDEYVMPFELDMDADRTPTIQVRPTRTSSPAAGVVAHAAHNNSCTSVGRVDRQVRPRNTSAPARTSTHTKAEYVNVLRRCDCGKEHTKSECPHLHKLKCSFCLNVHRNIVCDRYPTVKERIARIRQLKLCGHCLRPGHGSRKCTLKLRPCLCDKVHNSALCEVATSTARAGLSKVAVTGPKLDMANTTLIRPSTLPNPKPATSTSKAEAPRTGPPDKGNEVKPEEGSENNKATNVPHTNAIPQSSSKEPDKPIASGTPGSMGSADKSNATQTNAKVQKLSHNNGNKEQRPCPCGEADCAFPWSVEHRYHETWIHGPGIGQVECGDLKCRLCTRDKPCGTCDFTRSPFFPSNDLTGVHGFDREARLDDFGDKTTQKQCDPADTQPTKLRLERRVVLPCTRMMVTADMEFDLGEDRESPTAHPVTLFNTGSKHNYVSQALVENLGLDILRRERVRVPQLGNCADKRLLDVAELYIHGATVGDELSAVRCIEAYVVECILDSPTEVVIPTRRSYQALIHGDSYSASIVRRTPQLLLGIIDGDFLGLRDREHRMPAGFTVFDSIAGPIITGEGWVRLAANQSSDESTSHESEHSECSSDEETLYDYCDDPPTDMEGDAEDVYSFPHTGEANRTEASSTSHPWLTMTVGHSSVTYHSEAEPRTISVDSSGIHFS